MMNYQFINKITNESIWSLLYLPAKRTKRKHCLLGQQLFALTVLPVASTFSFVEHVQGEKTFHCTRINFHMSVISICHFHLCGCKYYTFSPGTWVSLGAHREKMDIGIRARVSNIWAKSYCSKLLFKNMNFSMKSIWTTASTLSENLVHKK